MLNIERLSMLDLSNKIIVRPPGLFNIWLLYERYGPREFAISAFNPLGTTVKVISRKVDIDILIILTVKLLTPKKKNLDDLLPKVEIEPSLDEINKNWKKARKKLRVF